MGSMWSTQWGQVSAAGKKPVYRAHKRGIVACIFRRRPGEKPDSHTQYHHHHAPHQQDVGMGGYEGSGDSPAKEWRCVQVDPGKNAKAKNINAVLMK